MSNPQKHRRWFNWWFVVFPAVLAGCAMLLLFFLWAAQPFVDYCSAFVGWPDTISELEIREQISAAIFTSLAFAGVVLTVFMHSHELRLQREELWRISQLMTCGEAVGLNLATGVTKPAEVVMAVKGKFGQTVKMGLVNSVKAKNGQTVGNSRAKVGTIGNPITVIEAALGILDTSSRT